MESSPAEEMLKKGDFSGLAALCEQEELQVRCTYMSQTHYGDLSLPWPGIASASTWGFDVCTVHMSSFLFVQSEGGVASPQVYGTLLAIYLLQNEL